MDLQLVIDSNDPGRLAGFWAAALTYVPEPAPDGFETWDDWYRSVGVPDDELDGSIDRIVDPGGRWPRIWFQKVPETKTVKNRLHLDLIVAGKGVPIEERRATVDAVVARLVADGGSVIHTHDGEVEGHYGVTLADPEGNELCVT